MECNRTSPWFAAIWSTRFVVLCAVAAGCKPPSAATTQMPSTADESVNVKAEELSETTASDEGLNALVELDWTQLNEALAADDQQEVARLRKSIVGSGSIGMTRLNEIVAKKQGELAQRLLASELLGEMAPKATELEALHDAATNITVLRDELTDEQQKVQATKSIDAALSAAEVLAPDNFVTIYYRGDEELTLGHFDRAIEQFDKAIAIDPKEYNARLLRGLACQRKGDHAEAIDTFTRAIELHPEKPELFRRRASSYLVENKLEESLADVEHALAMEPGHKPAETLRTHLLEKLGREKSPPAREGGT